MQLSARIATFACAAFGLVCLGFAASGLLALPEITDEAQRELTRGYTGFWLFLFAIAVVFAVLSHLMATGRLGTQRSAPATPDPAER